MTWRGANVGEPDWETLRDASIRINEALSDGVLTIPSSDVQILLNDKNDYTKELRAKKARVQSDRGRRYTACKAFNDLRQVVENIPESQIQAEILNQITVLQRMVLIINDGAVSPQIFRV